MIFTATSGTPLVVPIKGFLTKMQKITPVTVGVIPSSSVSVEVQITENGYWYPVATGQLVGEITEPKVDTLIAPAIAVRFTAIGGNCTVEIGQ